MSSSWRPITYNQLPILDNTKTCIPCERIGHSAVMYEGEMWIFGGMGKKRYNDIYKFHFDTCQWTHIEHANEEQQSVPCPRLKHSAVVYKNKMYIWGGWAHTKLNDMWVYDFHKNIWQEIKQKGSIPSPRSSHGVVVVRDCMILYGGIGGNKFKDMYVFNFSLQSWSPAKQNGEQPGTRSSYGGLHVYRGDLYLFAGLTCGKLNDIFKYELKEGRWIKVEAVNPDRAPSKRGRHSCVIHGDRLYTFGGYAGIETVDSFFFFDFTTHSWNEIKRSGGTPRKREAHTMVIENGNRIILFGGMDGNVWYNDMHQFSIL